MLSAIFSEYLVFKLRCGHNCSADYISINSKTYKYV
ncbi:MAG: hypothetical protein BROFUL_02052 [Candidatus Brocadia fulgida]|uniref:Uncharacterized protein n=1 Tax=Candidatus Brocadia fulgida TaxID=380242 RepID=A0A0M2UTW1_9BACT|nr:MAG: hypothetical protein BROFUL_02052 [Candidatus Brocadia fulgida]